MERLLTVVTVASVALIVLVLFSVRRAHIRVEYSVSWLGAAVTLLVLSRFEAALNWIAGALGIENPPVALLLLGLSAFLPVFYRFSVVISQLKDANISLAQRVAILEYRLESQRGNEDGQAVAKG